MKIITSLVGGAPEILNRQEFEAVSMTIDFTGTSAKFIYAGTPIDKYGKPVVATPFSGAIGILLQTVRVGNPEGVVLITGFVHTRRAETESSLRYDGYLVNELKKAGCHIRFEEPLIIGESGGSVVGEAIVGTAVVGA